MPWSKGLGVEETEAYFDDPKNFPDNAPAVHIENGFSKAPTILAEHPDYELYLKGTHAKNNVSCTDCHMPYTSDGASKFTHHNITSPLKDMDKSCLTCHPGKKDELAQIVKDKKFRVDNIGQKALDNIAKAHLEAKKVWEVGAKDKEMKEALRLIRKAQWRYTYVRSSFGAYFHATDESLRIYADANDYAHQAREAIGKILAKYGAGDYVAPDFKTKEEVFKYANLPNRDDFIKEKCDWIKTTGKEWLKKAKENGTLSEELYDIDKAFTYFDHACK